MLLPYGWPPGALREAAHSVLLGCGGDVDRLIDQPADDLPRFLGHAARIPALRDDGPREPTIVFMTRTSPIPLTVSNARRTMENKIPSLRSAAWVLFVRSDDDPFFEEGATRLGMLASGIADSPIWIGPEATPYLVTTPESDLSVLPGRMMDLRSRTEKLRRGGVSTTTRRPPRP